MRYFYSLRRCFCRMKELLGYDESDLLGRSFFDYCHVCDIKQVDNCFQKCECFA